MALVIGNAREAYWLDLLLNDHGPFTLRLYGNNRTPASSDLLNASNYTEIAGGGYAPITLVTATWVISQGAPTQAVYPVQLFTFSAPLTSPGTIYGYMIVDAIGQLVGAERLPAPPFTPAAADSLEIFPVLTLGSVSGD
jgi:hypothetical protein